MPRAVPPASRTPTTPEPFFLSDADRSKIATTLGLPKLPPLMLQMIEAGVARYRTQSERGIVSAGENIAAIDEALKAAKHLERALRPFTDGNTGVGEKTFHELKPSASGLWVAITVFNAKASHRKGELRRLGRLGVEHGPLGQLCALLHLLFKVAEEGRHDGGNSKSRLRTFALAVFEASDIPCEDYHFHPARMDSLFGPPVLDDLQTQFVEQLRREIEELFAERGQPPSKVQK